MSYQFELALRQYIAAFDGTNSISEEDFQSLFDNLSFWRGRAQPWLRHVPPWLRHGFCYVGILCPFAKDQLSKCDFEKNQKTPWKHPHHDEPLRYYAHNYNQTWNYLIISSTRLLNSMLLTSDALLALKSPPYGSSATIFRGHML